MLLKKLSTISDYEYSKEELFEYSKQQLYKKSLR